MQVGSDKSFFFLVKNFLSFISFPFPFLICLSVCVSLPLHSFTPVSVFTCLSSVYPFPFSYLSVLIFLSLPISFYIPLSSHVSLSLRYHPTTSPSILFPLLTETKKKKNQLQDLYFLVSYGKKNIGLKENYCDFFLSKKKKNNNRQV